MDTAPSKRILSAYPQYAKTIDGPLVIAEAARDAAVAGLWSADARACTAASEYVGLDAITRRVAAAYEKFVAGQGNAFRQLGPAEAHHDGGADPPGDGTSLRRRYRAGSSSFCSIPTDASGPTTSSSTSSS
ncbi:MAG TPA: hypothetical protein VHZ03_19490 [Trebonia sp.]|nr:hypothetical protein [Trebonia sp.]